MSKCEHELPIYCLFEQTKLISLVAVIKSYIIRVNDYHRVSKSLSTEPTLSEH